MEVATAAVVEEEEERREDLEGKTTDTRTVAAGPEVTDRAEVEVVEEGAVEAMGDLATVEVETPTGADLQVPRAAAEETMADLLMIGGERGVVRETHTFPFSCIYILPGEVVFDWHLPSLASILGRSRFS